jgi:hypothetical protein
MHIRFGMIALACACLPALARGEDAAWSLRMATQDPVPYHGLADGEGGGAPGTMMYPAPGLAGLVAAIATHAAIVGSVRNSAQTEAEKKADKVLDPLRGGLGRFTQRDLAAPALDMAPLRGARLLSTQDTDPAGKTVDSAPTFFLTQQGDALLLDNTIKVTRPGAQPYQGTIRVVSAPHRILPEDLAAHWGADEARTLKAESAQLMALSLAIALAQSDAPAASAGTAATPFQTVRYLQGKKELFERAQVLDERCGRALIRNLRGWLMSVPLARPAADVTGCGDAAAH